MLTDAERARRYRERKRRCVCRERRDRVLSNWRYMSVKQRKAHFRWRLYWRQVVAHFEVGVPLPKRPGPKPWVR